MWQLKGSGGTDAEDSPCLVNQSPLRRSSVINIHRIDCSFYCAWNDIAPSANNKVLRISMIDIG